MTRILFLSILVIASCTDAIAQDPHRFDSGIKTIAELPIPNAENTTVFTGSSSIRVWEQLAEDCSGMQVINSGFGGSHMSDLLYFLDETVIRFRPSTVYIYSGDNDIASGKSPESILETTKQVSNRILESNPHAEIYFICAKPSPARWNFKEFYIAYNSLLKKYSERHDQLHYIDVWHPMLDETNRVNPDIFTSDSLHMNRQGYLIWKDLICNPR